ncbi:MAG TPA: GNAT family protein [Magnetospirillaceae bacterium]|jgi:RimJ/RimL family protein N-acetyltransferase
MLKGSKISIGPFLANDSEALFRWFNDAETARWDLAYRPTDWIAFKSWIESISKDGTRVLFAIRRNGETSIVGFIGMSAINPVHRSADLAVRIGDESNRGKGYGKEAIALALDFGWRHLNLHRVALTTLADNPRAIACFKSAGFEQEGLARQAAFIDGQWHDVTLMGALRTQSG